MSDKMTYMVTWYNAWINNAPIDNHGDHGSSSAQNEYATLDEVRHHIETYISNNPPRYFFDHKNPESGINFLEFEYCIVDECHYDAEDDEWETEELGDEEADTLNGNKTYEKMLDMGPDAYGYAATHDAPLDLQMKPYDNDTSSGRYVPLSWPKYINNDK